METTGGDASWLNKKHIINNISINNMVISGLLDSNQHANKWCCLAYKPAEVNR